MENSETPTKFIPCETGKGPDVFVCPCYPYNQTCMLSTYSSESSKQQR